MNNHHNEGDRKNLRKELEEDLREELHKDHREDLFLDNEDEPDEDQISGSGDRPLKRPDVGSYRSNQNDRNQNGIDRSDDQQSDFKQSYYRQSEDRKRGYEPSDDGQTVRPRTAGRPAASQKVTATIR